MLDDAAAPTVTFSHQFAGRGYLLRDGKRASVPRFTLTYTPYDGTTDLQFDGVVAPDARDDARHILTVGPLPSFEGSCLEGTLRIPGVFWRNWVNEEHLVGQANAVILNDATLPAKPDEQYATFHLSPTPLALSEKDMLVHSYTGEISDRLGAIENPVVEWPTPFATSGWCATLRTSPHSWQAGNQLSGCQYPRLSSS